MSLPEILGKRQVLRASKGIEFQDLLQRLAQTKQVTADTVNGLRLRRDHGDGQCSAKAALKLKATVAFQVWFGMFARKTVCRTTSTFTKREHCCCACGKSESRQCLPLAQWCRSAGRATSQAAPPENSE